MINTFHRSYMWMNWMPNKAFQSKWYTALSSPRIRLWVRALVWACTCTNASRYVCKYVDWKGSAACWPLYSQQVLQQRCFWGSHKQESMQEIHPGFELICGQLLISTTPKIVQKHSTFSWTHSWHYWHKRLSWVITKDFQQQKLPQVLHDTPISGLSVHC